MRIAILTTALTGGGAEFVAGAWANWLAEEGNEVRAILTDPHAAIPESVPFAVHRVAGGGSAATVRQVRAALRAEPWTRWWPCRTFRISSPWPRPAGCGRDRWCW